MRTCYLCAVLVYVCLIGCPFVCLFVFACVSVCAFIFMFCVVAKSEYVAAWLGEARATCVAALVIANAPPCAWVCVVQAYLVYTTLVLRFDARGAAQCSVMLQSSLSIWSATYRADHSGRCIAMGHRGVALRPGEQAHRATHNAITVMNIIIAI